MPSTICLNDYNVRLFKGRLYNHDYLWFSSNEISKVSTTLPFIHNYALCYALGQISHRICKGSVPKYVEDPDAEFGMLPLYSTPASAVNVGRTVITFNAVNSLTLTTGDSKTLNTPNLGKRVYLNPCWESSDFKPQLGFTLYVFTYDGYNLPSVFRLGKKGAAMRAYWKELIDPVAVFSDDAHTPIHPVNPLDVSGNIVKYDPIMLPPHMLLRTATVAEDWFVITGKQVVHVPKRVFQRIGVAA